MKGAVAAGHPLTAEAGARILAEGGNAVDACVAAAFVSWVAESPLTGPGGGGFMLVHRARDGADRLLDFFVAVPGEGLPPGERGEMLEVDIAFDDAGRMWVATDGIDETLGPNDGVFMVELDGPERGSCKRFLSAPTGSEVCGPEFTPDNKTFFVAIQHPGLTDKGTYEAPGSRWPDNRPDMPPRPSVVAIYRPDGRKIGE
jgi:hypothetical protein